MVLIRFQRPSFGPCARRVRAEAERKAINSTVQGSAADVIKAAMVGWWRWAEEAGAGPGGAPMRLVAQIHDEASSSSAPTGNRLSMRTPRPA